MDEADIRNFTGDQGQGKSCSGVAVVVDDCFLNLTGLITPTGAIIKAKSLNEDETERIQRKEPKATDIHLRYMRVYSPDGLSSKIIEKPKGWMIDTPIRVFCNFHFYGLRFVYVDTELIVSHMNENIETALIKNGWVVLDESFMTDKRDTMSSVGKMMSWFGAQGRRRNLHVVLISQFLDMQQSRLVRFGNTRVLCSYNKHTQMVHLDVNRKSEVMRSCDYKASDYWRFYQHDELVQVPQYRIDRTLKAMHELASVG